VIGPSGTVRVMVATKPVDFRKGMEGLAALVREHMKVDRKRGFQATALRDCSR
jgi:transposase